MDPRRGMGRMRRAWLGALVLGAVVVATGCGGGDGNRDGNEDETPGAAAVQPAQGNVSPPAGVPDGKLLFVAFVREWTGKRDLVLHIANSDGSGARGIDGQLNGTDSLLSPIPGTQRVVYPACDSTCHARVYDVGTDERYDIPTQHRVVGVAASNDGKSIVYTSGEAVYTADIDGSDERELFRFGPKTTVFGLAWSPDNRSIAFLAGVRGQDPVVTNDTRDVYVVPAGGGAPVQVGTIGEECDPLSDPEAAACSATSPIAGVRVDQVVWARDGSYLVLSGRQRDRSGEAWDSYAGALTVDGQPVQQDASVRGVCGLGSIPGICGVTYLFEHGNLALLKEGGIDLQVVDLAKPSTVAKYRMGPPDRRDGDLAVIRTAVWVPAPADGKASASAGN